MSAREIDRDRRSGSASRAEPGGDGLAARRLIAFLALTFALTWSIWIGGAAIAGSANRGFFGAGGPIFLVGIFAPGFVALALTWRERGSDGVAALFGRIGRFQVGFGWYVFAVLYFPAIKLASAAIVRLLTGVWPPFGETPWPLLFGAILLSTWVQAGEEVGWRGYALGRMAARIGLGPASVLLGALWALWHLPLFVLPNTGSDGQSFPLYALHVMALSVAMAWVYWRTDGSLLLVMIMHAAVNNTTSLVPGALPGATDPFTLRATAVGWIAAALSWLVALPMLLAMRDADIGALADPPDNAAT
jgi:membrane protease YdiL (CAAX protease family)